MLAAGCAPGNIGPTPSPITLRFAYRQQGAEMEALLKQFTEQHSWINVEPVEIVRAGDDMRSYVANREIDLFRDSREALTYIDENLLKPLDDVQLADWADIRDDYYKGAWEALAIQGQQWGIPAGLDIYVAFVNVDQANALSVQLPGNDWTLYDFEELVNKMNYPEGLPGSSARLYGFCTAAAGMDPVVFIYLHGGQIVDDLNAPKAAMLDYPLTVEAVQWYSDLFNRYGVAPSNEVIRQVYPRYGINEAQVRGGCAVWLGFYSARGGRNAPIEWTIKWKMLPLPKDGMDSSMGEIDGYFVSAKSTHPKEALMLARFLADHWEAAGNQLPPRQSLVTSKGYRQSVGEEIADIAASKAGHLIVVPAQIHPALEAVGTQFFTSLQAIIAQDLDAGAALGAAQSRLDAVFRQ
jgi:ABC-type glycerol-3-phosphate transport system substrate-binding protein